MPLSESTQKCDGMLCQRPGTLRCSGCRGADPETLYCSQKCQKEDWKYHKAYCGKQAYVFHVYLLGSNKPKITRKVAIPSWWTFHQFHFALQYIFLPWQNTHLHMFQFCKQVGTAQGQPDFGFSREVLLELCPEGDASTSDRWYEERNIRLSDVYGEGGRLRPRILIDGNVAPLLYQYDFGDNWEHKITFVKSELARAARPLVKEAYGCGPVEDSGGIEGWKRVKKAFAAVSPTSEQLELRGWAKSVSGREDFNALEEPNVTHLNYEGRWENHERGFREGERPLRDSQF